jgi:hypothetical protein
MQHKPRSSPISGIALGVALTITAALVMGQAASTPVKSSTEYFVTSDGHATHLWAREGAKLRCVGHGECAPKADDGHEHHEGDGHDHGGEPKKP